MRFSHKFEWHQLKAWWCYTYFTHLSQWYDYFLQVFTILEWVLWVNYTFFPIFERVISLQVRKVHFSIALVLIFKVQLLKKNQKKFRAVKVYLSLNLVTFLPIITVLLFIFIKKHIKNNESVQNFEWMESYWSKLVDYVKRFDKYFMSSRW